MITQNTTQSTTLTMTQPQSSRGLNLTLALRYPFQGQGWFNRLLILSLAQLLPIVGQLILVGYGVQVVRAISAGQSDLPRVQWQRALVDGLKVALTGLIYMTPLLLTGVVSLSGAKGGSGLTTIPVIIVLSIIVAPLGSRLQKQGGSALKLLGRLLTLTPLVAIVVSVISGIAAFVTAQNSVSAASTSPAEIGLPLLVGMGLLAFVILTGTFFGAVRFAIENKGLFDAPGNLKLLLQHRKATGVLMLNLIALLATTVVATGIGLALLIVPGVFILVGCSVAIWQLFAQFGTQIGLSKAAPVS